MIECWRDGAIGFTRGKLHLRVPADVGACGPVRLISATEGTLLLHLEKRNHMRVFRHGPPWPIGTRFVLQALRWTGWTTVGEGIVEER